MQVRARAALVPLLASLVVACGTRGEVPARPRALPDASTVTPAPVAAPKGAPKPVVSRIQHRLHSLRYATGEASVHQFTIPLRRARVEHVDLKYQAPLVDALGSYDLVINGGYWGYREKERVIEGLLVVNGHQLAPPHAHGGVLELRAGSARVVRGEDFVLAPDTMLALQCNPRLVDAGNVVPKLEAVRRAARTALCVTTARHELAAYLTLAAITLPELAGFLREQGCIEALNLDGGPSTAAVASLADGISTVGRGEALPYALGFVAH
jgi:hypothetical protein